MEQNFVNGNALARVSLEQSQHKVFGLARYHVPALFSFGVGIEDNWLSDSAESNFLFIETLTIKWLLSA